MVAVAAGLLLPGESGDVDLDAPMAEGLSELLAKCALPCCAIDAARLRFRVGLDLLILGVRLLLSEATDHLVYRTDRVS